MQFPTIRTARLTVREFALSDRDGLLAFTADPGQLHYMLFSLASPAEVDELLELARDTAVAEPRCQYHLAVELAAAESSGGASGAAGRPQLIGSVALMGKADNPAEAELGYYFLRARWGRGYAVEASRPLLDFAFGQLKLHRVWGKCHILNPGSARVMSKLGMVHEGTMREHVWLRDHYRSSDLFGMLDREWAAAKT